MCTSFENDGNSGQQQVLTTVIVVHYNTPELLFACLDTFCRQSLARGWQVIVVDNGSDQDVSSSVSSRFAGVDVLRSERNLGFGRGSNLGLREARGRFVILLNTDVIASSETLQALVQEVSENRQIGAMSPGLLTPDGSPQAYAYGSRTDPWYVMRRGLRRLMGWGPLHDWRTREPLDVDWVSAACICVRQEVFKEVGGFDERFYLYFEDTDWGLRMRKAGWRVIYDPRLQVVHLGGATRTAGSVERQGLYYRSLLLFSEKHYGYGWRLLLHSLIGPYRALQSAKAYIAEAFRPETRSVFQRDASAGARGASVPVRAALRRPGPSQPEAGADASSLSAGLQNREAPEFSVMMPVWNRAALAPRAIKSVLAQTLDDHELIIVDDGSEDELEMALRPFLSDSVRYQRIAHSGVAAARNAAMSMAKGRYIAYLDSDNVWDPRFLEIMRDELNKGPVTRHAAYCSYRLFKQDRSTGAWRLHAIRGEEFDFGTLLRRNYVDINTLVHSRQAAADTGPWDETLTRLTDWDYVFRLASRYEPVFVRAPLVDYYSGAAPNALSLTFRENEPRKMILRKTSSHRHSITLHHDSVPYHFKNVPEKKYRNWVAMRKRSRDTSGFYANGYPYLLQVEPTNRCNLACPFCPTGRRDLGRKLRDMRFDEIKPLIDEMADYLLLLVLYDWGEPLLNQDFPKMVQYAGERGIRTMTSTNGHTLGNEAFVADVLRAGLDTLVVAVDSLDQETYSRFRRNGDIQKVLAGIENAVALKRRLQARTRINMRMVVTRHNEWEIPELREMARRLGVDIFSLKTVNPNGGLPLQDDAQIIPANPHYRRYRYKKNSTERIRIENRCAYIWTLANVDVDGTVAACCYDFDGSMVLGNIHETPFREIWNGEAAREIRRRVYFNQHSIPRCRDCDVNFALSRGGWFPDYVDFRSNRLSQTAGHVKRTMIIPAARRALDWFGLKR
jgi:N-acetylglucosaminyl-diphospho-decaprenol L-rhamnosyltransferase